jgi:hypothetical protein
MLRIAFSVRVYQYVKGVEYVRIYMTQEYFPIYFQWLRATVEIADTISLARDSTEVFSRAKEFLNVQGFNNVTEDGNRICASRGRKFFCMINLEDPRRNFHTIDIAVGSSRCEVKFKIQSWFTIGGKNDNPVFLAESAMLKHFLKTGTLDKKPLQHPLRMVAEQGWVILKLAVLIGCVIGVTMTVIY